MSSDKAPKPLLRLLSERKLADLLPRGSVDDRLEPSGVLAEHDYLYVVFDNVTRVARIGGRLSNRRGAAWLGSHSEEKGFEDIAYSRRKKRFYLLIEARRVDGGYHGGVVETDGRFHQIRRVSLDFPFESENKGFEGLTCVGRGKDEYLLALCEGNKCKAGKKGRKPGGGRIQVFQAVRDTWRHVDTIRMPKSVAFEDYSGLDVRGRRVAVVSQASSGVWIGSFAPDSWDLMDDGLVYSFPTDAKNRTVYCNAEGIAWLAADRLAIVSDRVRPSKDRERCRQKDQSVHIFALE